MEWRVRRYNSASGPRVALLRGRFRGRVTAHARGRCGVCSRRLTDTPHDLEAPAHTDAWEPPTVESGTCRGHLHAFALGTCATRVLGERAVADLRVARYVRGPRATRDESCCLLRPDSRARTRPRRVHDQRSCRARGAADADREQGRFRSSETLGPRERKARASTPRVPWARRCDSHLPHFGQRRLDVVAVASADSEPCRGRRLGRRGGGGSAI